MTVQGPRGLAVWPATSSHRYLRLFYDALSRQGFRIAFDNVPVNDTFLTEQADAIAALHFHWPEFIWKSRHQATPYKRLRTVVGLWKYLRVARASNVPVLWTLHNLQRHESPDWIDSLGMRLFARFSSLVVVHSESARVPAIRSIGVSPENIHVMPIGRDSPAMLPSQNRGDVLKALGLYPERRTLLCFGLVRHYKGFDLAVDAVRSLGSDYQLIVAGAPLDAVAADSLRTSAAGVSNVRLLLEGASDQALSNLLGAADAVLFPYREITGSAALLTAIGAGRAVVAADLPFFREVLGPERDAAQFCEPNNARALACAIEGFFGMPVLQRHAAAERLASHYDWDRVVQPLAARLHAICRRRPTNQPSLVTVASDSRAVDRHAVK